MGGLTGLRVSGTEDPTVGTFLKYCLESHVSGKWKENNLGHFQKMVANDSWIPSVLLGYTWHFRTRVAGIISISQVRTLRLGGLNKHVVERWQTRPL